MILSEKNVHEILNRFDFDSVHEYMKNADWTWCCFNQDGPRIPTLHDLYSNAKELLFDVLNHKDDSTIFQCGGFAAIKIKNIGLMLFFVPFEEDVWVS